MVKELLKVELLGSGGKQTLAHLLLQTEGRQCPREQQPRDRNMMNRWPPKR